MLRLQTPNKTGKNLNIREMFYVQLCEILTHDSVTSLMHAVLIKGG